ncbi:MAG: SAM-dependent methyltransferase, partial [Candidatus Poribacteria bacterium]|nr:SAM-dependent methyltransferase [Candidatus Poribacteria bacterium]
MSEISLDIDKLEALSGKVVTDITGAIGVLLSYIGDQSGVYRALEAHGPCTTSQLASTTGLNERYLQEFLSSNAGSGYVTYDGQANEFSITPEQAAVLVHEGE